MLEVLGNRTYRHLFVAQVVALVGTGLATVALALLAFDLAGDKAGQVLGFALAIKMVAYIVVAPVAAAFADFWPRRSMLVALDLVRALVALSLPFVSAVWQVYVLIFLLQSASAAFTPTFQATIPDILSDDKDYTRALSLSRLAYDLESVVSPMLAAALLTVLSFHSLFAGTVVGFLLSAGLVASVTLPAAKKIDVGSIYERTTRGGRIYLATPRLRGLLVLNVVIAAASAMVIVNTVVLVQVSFGLTQKLTALALAFFGGGSMAVALGLPNLLQRFSDREVMLSGGAILVVGLWLGGVVGSFYGLLLLWLLLGAGYSLAQTPTGRLLKRSAHAEDRPALFAAQFALSHACWLFMYPLAGWLGVEFGLAVAFVMLGVVGAVAWLVCWWVWPRYDPLLIAHRHDDFMPDHPHLSAVNRQGGFHIHEYVIDEEHRCWPKDNNLSG